jgi:hypothetical protein
MLYYVESQVIMKRLFLLTIVENIWMRRFDLQRDRWVVFPPRKTLIENILPSMMKCTLQALVFPFINATIFVTAIFDLCMNKSAFDTFALVINFLTLDWEPKHVTIGLFEAKGTFGVSLVGQLQALFEKYKLTNKMICYMKDESIN